jgi:hypothetical protein
MKSYTEFLNESDKDSAENITAVAKSHGWNNGVHKDHPGHKLTIDGFKWTHDMGPSHGRAIGGGAHSFMDHMRKFNTPHENPYKDHPSVKIGDRHYLGNKDGSVMNHSYKHGAEATSHLFHGSEIDKHPGGYHVRLTHLKDAA